MFIKQISIIFPTIIKRKGKEKGKRTREENKKEFGREWRGHISITIERQIRESDKNYQQKTEMEWKAKSHVDKDVP